MRLSRFFPLISFFFLMMAASSFAQDKPDPRKYPEPQNQPEQQDSPQYSDQSGSAQDSPGYGNQPEHQDQQATPDSQDQQRQPDYNNQTDQQSAPQYGNQADQQGQQPAPDDRDRQYSPDDRHQPEQYPPDPRTQPRAELPPPPPSRPEPSQEWMPDAIAYLRQNASSKTEFNLDHSMVVLASKIDDNDPDLRRVVAGVDGVSIHRFHFDGYGMYDPRVLADVRQQYRTAGWQHISKGHGRNGGPGQTDFWVQLDNMTIRNVAVLFTGPNQVTLVSVSCAISPIDLTHLGGHFGIPQMQGGVVLPRARNDSRPYQPQGY